MTTEPPPFPTAPWQEQYYRMCVHYLEILKRVGRPDNKEAKAQHNALQAFRVRHASIEGTQRAEIPETVIPALVPEGRTKSRCALKRTYERESNV